METIDIRLSKIEALNDLEKLEQDVKFLTEELPNVRATIENLEDEITLEEVKVYEDYINSVFDRMKVIKL